jgi:hypothetical protein
MSLSRVTTVVHYLVDGVELVENPLEDWISNEEFV